QLQLLLGAEAAHQSALTHAEMIGQSADGQALETHDRRELHRGVERLCSRACDFRGGSACHRPDSIYGTVVSYILRTLVLFTANGWRARANQVAGLGRGGGRGARSAGSRRSTPGRDGGVRLARGASPRDAPPRCRPCPVLG